MGRLGACRAPNIDLDPAKVEEQARLIASAPQLAAFANGLIEWTRKSGEEMPTALVELGPHRPGCPGSGQRPGLTKACLTGQHIAANPCCGCEVFIKYRRPGLLVRRRAAVADWLGSGLGNLMDTKKFGAPTRHSLHFEGTGGEYFDIWIVNLALTVVTLGIFSAWAKVRNRRYFYGNTHIDTHAFDYHASPWRILLGRVIALALLLGYSLTAAMAPKAVFAWGLLFLVALPWLVRSSLRFNARNTSYRNVRFDFSGTYTGALKAFVLWPLFTAITLFTTLPLGHRARDYYNINNHSFGGKCFSRPRFPPANYT